jgi:hypothetical protein
VTAIVELAQGIGATLAAAALFYLAGVTMLPSQWFSRDTGASPLVVGAAIYAVACWIAVSARAIPLSHVVAGFVVAVALVASQRLKSVLARVRTLNQSSVQSLAVFVAFYAVAHLLMAPPMGGRFLPLPANGSLELITHAHHARLLLENGSSSFSHAMFDVGQHPAVASLLAGYSFFFDRDPLAAALPAQTAAAAATALLVMTLARSMFALSFLTSAVLGFITITAPLYKSAASASLLATMLGIPVVLYLVVTTLKAIPQKSIEPLAAYFAAAYALLWLLDPLMLLVALLMQAAVATLVAFQGDEGPLRASRIAANAVLPLAVLGATLHQRVAATPRLIMSYFQDATSYQAVGVISPLAVLGWPSASLARMQADGASRQAFALAAYLALGIALWFAYRRSDPAATPGQRLLSRTTSLAFVAAVVLFLAFGSSVGHWRVASSLLLPLAFVPLAVLANIVQITPARLRLRSTEDIRLSRAVISYAAVAIVVGNVAVFAYATPLRDRPVAAWRQLEEVRQLRLQSVTARLDEDSPQLVALSRYYLAGTRVDFIDAEAGIEPRALEAISSNHPMFVRDAGCAAVGHNEVVSIDGLGCLIMSPPTVALDTGYSFQGRFLFLSYQGLTARKGGGRWNANEVVELRVTADPSRVRVDQDLHVNVLLNPFLTSGAHPRRLRVEWSNGDVADADLPSRDWISVPVRSGDWSGNRLWSVPIRIRMLDGRALLFEALSVTVEPSERAVERRSG